MNPKIAAFLTSPAALPTLTELAADPSALAPAGQLATLNRLRRHFTPEQAAGLFELALARHRAVQQGKFSRASEMFFTKTALEQSSSEAIATHRLARYRAALPAASRVADLGCGIGGDSMALGRHFQVMGVDLDPARLIFARANAALYDLQNNFTPLQADITDFDPTGYAALFFDPARRTAAGRRIFAVEDYSPPLSIVRRWLPLVPNIGVKIAPGVNYAELAGYDCEVEIISENGDVKEAVLWFGKLRREQQGLPVIRRATLLPGGHTLSDRPGKPPVPVTEVQSYLFEPDGAVIRAGLVEELALLGPATKIDQDIAFLTAPHLLDWPFARAFRVLESAPFNLKKLNRRLQELDIGRVTIKKRGSPLEPAELERALKLKGRHEIIVVLTRVKGVHSTILCQPVVSGVEKPS